MENMEVLPSPDTLHLLATAGTACRSRSNCVKPSMILSITRIEILSVARFQSSVGGSEDTAILKTLASLSLFTGVHAKLQAISNERDRIIRQRICLLFKCICRRRIIPHKFLT